MSVTSANQIDSQSTWTETSRSTQVKYLIETNSSSDDSNVVLSYTGLPNIGSLLTSDKSQSLKSKEASLISSENDKTKWDVELNYASAEGDGGERDEDQEDKYTNPWNLPPYNISYGTIGRDVVAEKAYQDGDAQGSPSVPIVNKAEDPYDPPIIRQQFNALISFTYNLKDFQFTWIPLFRDTINKDPITILGVRIDQEKARLHGLGARQVATKNANNEDIVYWQVDISLEISFTKIQIELLEAGFNQITGGTKYKITILDDELEESYPSVPQLLDADGKKLAVGADPVYTPFKINYPADWTSLSIPKTRTVEIKYAN